ncbi:DNA ligase 1 [Nematocida sp. LUAm3]|nr:DNA ligase 1 [Nematocida sp. LUAm3]KAI5174031.1 DNA ligase 1 [Nematocida sp. LUAm2]KAI5177226.1 DNA ligase 1 [Nematocida sp. LUAm1]
MLWKSYTECLDSIEALSGRKEITRRLSSLFRDMSREDLLASLYLSIARVTEEANGLEMSTGEALLIKALSMLTSAPQDKIKERIKLSGDISSEAKVRQKAYLPFTKRKELTVLEVFNKLKEISERKGKDSAKQKTEDISALLSKCAVDSEAKYIVRILDGKLKIGLSIQTVLASLALSFVHRENKHENTPEDNVSIDKSLDWSQEEIDAMENIKNAYSQLPSLSKISEILFSKGLLGLTASLVSPGHPLRPMLAVAEKDPLSVISKFQNEKFIGEYKYDGERIQIHSANGVISLFSRGLESTTERFSSIIPVIKNSYLGKGDFILDGEVVAYDQEKKKILDFQTLSNRKRKITETNAEKIESHIALFLFDALYIDESLITLPLLQRKEKLSSSFREAPGELFIVEHHTISDGDNDLLNSLFSSSISLGCEGLMLKSIGPTSTYEPSKRSQKWSKLKVDYVEGMKDKFDLLVVGAYTGRGKRTGTYGGFLLASLNENNDLESVTKIGTGFSDQFLQKITEELKEHASIAPTLKVDQSIQPDVWFRPYVLWEVAAAGVSLSPRYTAAINSPELPEGKGLSLRFPRFIRKREDKQKEDCTRSVQILSEYLSSLQTDLLQEE